MSSSINFLCFFVVLSSFKIVIKITSNEIYHFKHFKPYVSMH